MANLDDIFTNRELDLQKRFMQENVGRGAGKGIGNMAKTINVGKALAEYTPYVGDIWDVGQGLYEATHGHPLVGTGQALLGGAGLAANIMFPGAGSFAKAGIKAGIKQGVKSGVKAAGKKATKKAIQEAVEPNKVMKAIENYAKFNRSAGGQILTAGAPNLLYRTNNKANSQDPYDIGDLDEIPAEQLTGGGSIGLPPLPDGYQGGMIGGQAPTQATLQEILQGAGNTNLPVASQTNEEDIKYLNDYITQLRDINQPYIDELKKYYNNYYKMLDRAQRAQGYWQGIAGLTGNQNWTKLADIYNPLTTEANRVNLVKQIQDAQTGDINAINEIMGNLAIADDLGLPPESVFANKNLLTAMSMKDRERTKLEIALANNLVKTYGIDKNYARALAVQALRNQGALDVANINAQAFGYGGNYQAAPGLTQQGTAQPTSAEGALFRQVTGR